MYVTVNKIPQPACRVGTLPSEIIKTDEDIHQLAVQI